MSLSLLLNELQIDSLKQNYKNYLLTSNNPYIDFIVDILDCKITVYKSKKAVFQGPMELEYAKEFQELNSYDNSNVIGSDEVGTGDVFGPIVVVAYYFKKENRDKLISLGVKDSKALTDEKIINIAKELIKDNLHETLICNNDKFNEMTNKGFNMNKIKAYLHNHAYIRMLRRNISYDYIIQDQFCSKENYFYYLADVAHHKDITFHHKAESKSLAVAAASIIARYYFLETLKKLEETYKVKILKGASNEVKEYIKTIDKAILPHIAKMNFKTITEE